MAERKPAKKGTQKAAKSTTVTGKKLEGFTDEERAAMRERVQELKAGPHAGKADGESAVLAKIAGMPAYDKDGQVVCFFQSAQKFNTRYATIGFSDKANLDEGHMWPTAFALKELTAAEEARIGALVRKAELR